MKQCYKVTLLPLLLTTTLMGSELGINLGSSHTGYTQSDTEGSITLGDEPETLFETFELYWTLPDTNYDDIKHILSLNYGYNDEFKHQYLLTGINKYHNNFYIGLLIGYGELTWKYDPINNAKDKNYDANSVLGGLQMGYDIPLSNHLALGINSKFLFSDYETTLQPTQGVASQITHNYTATVGVGMKYSF